MRREAEGALEDVGGVSAVTRRAKKAVGRCVRGSGDERSPGMEVRHDERSH